MKKTIILAIQTLKEQLEDYNQTIEFEKFIDSIILEDISSNSQIDLISHQSFLDSHIIKENDENKDQLQKAHDIVSSELSNSQGDSSNKVFSKLSDSFDFFLPLIPEYQASETIFLPREPTSPLPLPPPIEIPSATPLAIHQNNSGIKVLEIQNNHSPEKKKRHCAPPAPLSIIHPQSFSQPSSPIFRISQSSSSPEIKPISPSSSSPGIKTISPSSSNSLFERSITSPTIKARPSYSKNISFSKPTPPSSPNSYNSYGIEQRPNSQSTQFNSKIIITRQQKSHPVTPTNQQIRSKQIKSKWEIIHIQGCPWINSEPPPISSFPFGDPPSDKLSSANNNKDIFDEIHTPHETQKISFINVKSDNTNINSNDINNDTCISYVDQLSIDQNDPKQENMLNSLKGKKNDIKQFTENSTPIKFKRKVHFLPQNNDLIPENAQLFDYNQAAKNYQFYQTQQNFVSKPLHQSFSTKPKFQKKTDRDKIIVQSSKPWTKDKKSSPRVNPATTNNLSLFVMPLKTPTSTKHNQDIFKYSFGVL